ncbi:MAG: M12 family metallo-peptidase, partial [Acidobacteriota bacterium]
MQGKHLAADRYIAYADSELFGVDRTMGCDMDARMGAGAAEKLVSTPAKRLPLERPAALGTKSVGDCVGIYLEADYNIYQNKGSTQATTNWVTGIYNQLATLYSTDNIETGLSQVFVWNSSSPYTSGSNTGLLLSQFQNTRTSFNGDLGHLMKLGGISGVADGFSGICASNQAASQSVAYVQSTYSTVPTYSGTVFVVAHEIGHTAGSRHTHACVWNGNNTAIDGCSGFTEGNCSLPGNPSGGGTIMSYCPNTSVGVDFTQAFHPQPASVILNKIASASCLSASCSGGGGGGTCNGTTYSGSLSGTGDWDAQPNGTYFYEGSSGTHRGVLTGPGGADFDLELRKWNGSWAVVDSGTSPNSNEDVSYNGS